MVCRRYRNSDIDREYRNSDFDRKYGNCDLTTINGSSVSNLFVVNKDANISQPKRFSKRRMGKITKLFNWR